MDNAQPVPLPACHSLAWPPFHVYSKPPSLQELQSCRGERDGCSQGLLCKGPSPHWAAQLNPPLSPSMLCAELSLVRLILPCQALLSAE